MTIRDIAREAQVSSQAVSAVLNNKTNSRVSPATRERILQIAEAGGYRKSFSYRLLKKQVTHTVAVVLAMRQMRSEEHLKNLVLQLVERFNQRGCNCYFNSVMTPDARENLAGIRELISRGAEHFIFIGTPVGHDLIEEELLAQKRTWIGYQSHFARNLGSDSRGAARRVMEYFLRTGHTRFKLLVTAGDDGRAPVRDPRCLALGDLFPDTAFAELEQRRIRLMPKLDWDDPHFTETIFRNGYQATRRLMEQEPDTDAVFYLSDNYALGGAAYCYRRNLRVGRDGLLLAGFNHTEAVRHHVLPIISPEHRIGEAIDILEREAFADTPFRMSLPLSTDFLENNERFSL